MLDELNLKMKNLKEKLEEVEAENCHHVTIIADFRCSTEGLEEEISQLKKANRQLKAELEKEKAESMRWKLKYE